MAELLSNVNKRKATGCDGISARALKLAGTTLAPSLCGLFNQSITSATLPREWKSANVTPVHKGGDETNMNNYRPISVLPIVAKILERIVFDQLYDYLQEHSLLTPHQSGFRPGHSTQDILIKKMDDWHKELDSDHIVSALFVDLSKAFDTIDHKLLLEKLDMFFGVRNEEKMWFQAYLESRFQRVISGHSSSSWLVPRVGVPQGSILGPLLFVMFVNDLPTVISMNSVNMYADDTTLYYGGANVNDSIQVLQEDAQSVLQWLDCNRLTVNLKETNLMILGRRRRKKERIQRFFHVT